MQAGRSAFQLPFLEPTVTAVLKGHEPLLGNSIGTFCRSTLTVTESIGSISYLIPAIGYVSADKAQRQRGARFIKLSESVRCPRDLNFMTRGDR